MTLQDIEKQALKLSTKEKWQLVQALLNALEKDTSPSESIPKKTYPLRGLPITISDDFDKPMPDPFILTVNGKAELVVQDAQSYQELLEAAELVQTLKGIKRGLNQMKEDKGKTAESFFAEMFEQLDEA